MNNKYFEIYSKRINRISAILFLVSFIILSCFFNLQLLPHPELKNIILKHGYREKTVIGSRGKITDSNNRELAVTINRYTFWINTKKEFDESRIVDLFAKTFNKSSDYYIEKLKRSSSYTVLEKNISDAQSSSILDEIKHIKGLRVEKKPNRFYQYNNLASQTIGYINANSHGMLGIEKRCDHLLSGDTTKINLKKGAYGKYYNLDVLDETNIDGYDIQLTLNIELQRILQEELSRAVKITNAAGANGIIIDPNNGEILALASIPDFNPNYYNEFTLDSFNNAVISDAYEPGSTFKIVPVILALESDNYHLSDSIYCEEGSYRLSNNKPLHDHEEHGQLTIKEILIHSSNIGISKMSESFSDESIYKLSKKFGFGSKTYIPLSNESQGKIRSINEWSRTSKNYISIGQELAITNLQLAMAYGAIANGGHLIRPTLIKKIYRKDELKYINNIEVIRKVIDNNISHDILETLKEVVENGTAKSINLNGYNIAGKTGTAQKFKDGNYSNYIATFASIFPADNPNFVMIVSIDEPSYGKHWSNLSAVPASREIIKRMLVRDKQFHQSISKNITQKNEQDQQPILLSQNDIIEKINSVPNFRGKTLKESLKIAKTIGMTLEPAGISGVVKKQSIRAGSKLKPEMICKINMGI